MAINSYVAFVPYTGSPLLAESQVDMSHNTEELAQPDLQNFASAKQLFEVDEYSFDMSRYSTSAARAAASAPASASSMRSRSPAKSTAPRRRCSTWRARAPRSNR